MSACGSVVGGVSLDNVDVKTQSVIQGVVSQHNAPASVGYVRLLDKNDEFVAEVPVSKESAATLGSALPAKSELRCSPAKTRLSGWA